MEGRIKSNPRKMAFVAINASFLLIGICPRLIVWIKDNQPGGRFNLLKQMISLWIAFLSNISHRAHVGVPSPASQMFSISNI
jgi:hypothetical protein